MPCNIVQPAEASFRSKTLAPLGSRVRMHAPQRQQCLLPRCAVPRRPRCGQPRWRPCARLHPRTSPKSDLASRSAACLQVLEDDLLPRLVDALRSIWAARRCTLMVSHVLIALLIFHYFFKLFKTRVFFIVDKGFGVEGRG